jgi:TonB family protein
MLSLRAFSRCSVFSLVVLVLLVHTASVSHAQTPLDAANKRRLVYRTNPAYPALARSMALGGLVRLEAVVSPDGTVKKVEPMGGHPVLSQAAANAVRQWKWEPAPAESREPVQVKFSPE